MVGGPGPLHLCQRRHGNKRSRSILFERKQDSTTVFHFGIVDAGPPHEFPWSMAYTPSYETEAHIYAQYLLETHPRGKIAILYQDDGFGKDHVKGPEG